MVMAQEKGKTMSDYIKREDAISVLMETIAPLSITLDTLIMRIDDVPAADVVERSDYESMEHTVAKLNEAINRNAVEVVRCKDCKYWIPERSSCAETIPLAAFRDDDYCSYGERKEQEHE